MSDVAARKKFIHIMWDILRKIWVERLDYRQFYLLTFFDDMVTTSDRQPVFALRAFIAKVSAAIREMGLEALLVVEVHPIVNFPQKGAGRTLLVHIHAIGFGDMPFQHKSEEDYLNNNGTWNCALGAKPVRIQPIKTKTDLLAVGSYILKHPHAGKNLRQDHPTQKLQETIEGYRPELHLRVMELLSLIPFSKGIIGVGKGGNALKSDALRLLGKWHKERLKNLGNRYLSAHFSMKNFWAQLRETNGSKNYEPFTFLGEPEPKPRFHPRRHGPRTAMLQQQKKSHFASIRRRDRDKQNVLHNTEGNE